MCKKNAGFVLGVLVAVIGLSLCLSLCFPDQNAFASTGIEQALSFEGKVDTTSSGINITNGTYNVEFKIYSGGTSSGGGTLVWTEDYLISNSQGVTFNGGTFQVNLGSLCPLSGGSCTPSNANDGNTNSGVNWNTYPLYLSVQVGSTSSCSPSSNNFQTACSGDGEMSPYIQMDSSPYSFNSSELGGLTASQFGQLSATQTWTGLNAIQNSSTTGFQVVDNADSTDVITADTSGDAVDIGSTAGLVHPAELYVKNTNSANRTVILQAASGQSVDILDIYNGSGSFVSGYDSNGNLYLDGLLQTGTATAAGVLEVTDGSGHTTSIKTASSGTSYTISFPTAGATSGQCLESASGSSATNTTLTFATCGGGGGGGTTTVALLPEYAGAVFSASGSSNQGYMQSDHTAVSSGYTYNYYDWTTDQTSAQTYDVVLEQPVASTFNSFVASSMKVWAQVDSTSNNAMTVDVHDGSTDCTSGFQTITPSGTTWAQQSMPALSGCTVAANDILTFDFRLSATYASSTYYYARLGELSWQYQ